MTKERKLAIKMWLWIRDNQELMNYDKDGEDALDDLKCQFFKSEGIENPGWACNCWFCHYIMKRDRHGFDRRKCVKCPLKSCSEGPFYTLTHYPTGPDWWDACTEILEALGYDG